MVIVQIILRGKSNHLKSQRRTIKLKFEIYDDYTKANIIVIRWQKDCQVKQKIAEIEKSDYREAGNT